MLNCVEDGVPNALNDYRASPLKDEMKMELGIGVRHMDTVQALYH